MTPHEPPRGTSQGAPRVLTPEQFAAVDPANEGIPAYGTLIQVLSSSSPSETYTTIEGVGDITGPANTIGEIDTTSHSTGVPVKQTAPGLIDLGDISFPCYWNPAAPTQSINSPYGMEYLFFNRIRTKFQLICPDPTRRTRQFRGFIKSLGEDYKLAGVMTRNIAIRITAPWVDVASPITTTPASNLTVPNAGAPSNTFQVKAGGMQTPWTAIPSDPWITVTTPTSPTTGDASVTYAVAVGTPGTARSGYITISGLGVVFNITQMAT